MRSKRLKLKVRKDSSCLREKFQTKKRSKQKTILIDGLYIANRIKFSSTYNLSHEGNRTGLYYGMFSTIASLIKKFNSGNIIIFWDSDSRNSIRKEAYPDYKNRNLNATPQEIKEKSEFKKEAFGILNILHGLGFSCMILDKYEADDLIAVYCKEHPEEEKVIVTRDEDMYQLIDNNTIMYDVDKKIKKDIKWFKKTYEIEPFDWVMVKAQAGCKSDTVAGIRGIGERRSLDYLLNRCNEGIKATIEDNQDIVDRNLKLVKLPHPSLNSKIFSTLNAKPTDVNIDALIDLFQSMGFRQFMEDLDTFKLLSTI